MNTHFIKTIQKRIWIVVVITIVSGIAAYFLTQDMPIKYTSAAQLAVGLAPNLRATASVGNETGESKTDLQNHVEAMKTEFIGFMVSYRLLLHDLDGIAPFRSQGLITLSPEEKTAAKAKLQEKLNLFEPLSPYDGLESRLFEVLNQKEYDVARWITNGSLKVERVGNTNFIRVTCSSENSFLSAFVVNTLCQEYIRYNHFLNSTGSTDSMRFFTNLVDQKRRLLDEKADQLSRHREKKQVSRRPGNHELHQYQSMLRDAEIEVNRLLVHLRRIKSEIAERESAVVTKEPVDPGNSPKAKELQAKISELNKIYVNGGSRDRSLATTIKNLRDQLQAEVARLNSASDVTYDEAGMQRLVTEKDRVESQYKEAESELLSIRIKYNQLNKGDAEYLPDLEISSLQREYENALTDHEIAVRKLEKAKKNKPTTFTAGAGLKLIIPGQPDRDPQSPPTTTIIAFTMIVSCIVSALMVTVAARIQTPRRPINPTFVITR